MPTWGELLTEFSEIAVAQAREQPPGAPPPAAGPADKLRRRYLERLHEYTGRAVIVYATAWYESRPMNPQSVSVHLGDVRGFMEACSNVDGRELDLILHSPGGNPDAAESIITYLREQFDQIRAIVPLAAMSAATMMALACDDIVMGAHSQLGPVDPQVTVDTPEGPRTSPAEAIKDQFEMAQSECAADPSRIAAWLPLLRSLGPGLLAQCETAQERTKEFVARQLAEHMLSGDEGTTATDAAAWFADHGYFKSHGRQVTRSQAREQGVRVSELEDDPALQDLVLSVSHAIQLTFSNTPCAKLVENHHGRAWLVMDGSAPVQVVMGPQQQPPAYPPQPGPTG